MALEGQVWEAAQYAAQAELDHLIAFVDYNKKQLDGYIKDINNVRDIQAKFKSFGWYGQTVDGSKVAEIFDAVEKAKMHKGQPAVIVLDTIKGKGWSLAENTLSNHHMTVSKEQMTEALAEFEKELEKGVKE